MKKEKIIAVIPARGSSKTIPRKNLVNLGGKPLIAWPIELARSIKHIDRVIVSTDSDEIVLIAKKYGGEVLFKRPKSLAKDNTPTLPVLQHAIGYLEKKASYRPDIILLFYATTPFMRRARVIEALNLFKETSCNSIMGIKKDWGKFWRYDKGKYRTFYPKKRLNRQYYKPLYREAGNIYFSRYKVIMEMDKIVDENKIEFIQIDGEEELIDIDTPADLIRAKKWLSQQKR